MYLQIPRMLKPACYITNCHRVHSIYDIKIYSCIIVAIAHCKKNVIFDTP